MSIAIFLYSSAMTIALHVDEQMEPMLSGSGLLLQGPALWGEIQMS